MSFRIELRPSGHRYTAQAEDTVLEAALRAGLPVGYSCNHGTCGECKARLVDGTLGELLPHDYRLTEAEKQSGHFLMCSACPGSDLVIEALEASGAEDIPVQRIATRVGKRAALAPDVMSVQLRTPRTQTLRFLAGQHVRIEIPGQSVRRFSVASCPCAAMHLEFHIPRIPGDAFDEHVFTRLAPNDTVTVEGPYGHFTFDDHSRRPVLLLAYETGFSAMKSLIEHAMALEYPAPIRLYWVTRRRHGHYAENYCRAWTDAMDGFSYTLIAGEERQPAAEDAFVLPEQDLWLGAQQIVADQPDLAGFDVYTNGPESLTGSAQDLFRQHGLPAAQLRIDSV